MKDGPDSSDSDDRTTETVGSERAEVDPDHSIPEDAEWDQIVQKPVGESAYSGLTTTVISAVADAEGVQPRDIKDPPLFDVLDTAALEATFFPLDGRVHIQNGDTSAEFMYRGYRIVVQSDGWIRVYERRDG